MVTFILFFKNNVLYTAIYILYVKKYNIDDVLSGKFKLCGVNCPVANLRCPFHESHMVSG
jgi:hypothetical protein